MEDSEDKPTNRQVFEIDENKDQDPDYITVDKPHVALTVWNLLITGVCIGLFCFVNSYFTITLHKVVDNSIIREETAIFSCDNYFCDQTLYNYMNYYSYYQQCNQAVCTNVICTNYASQCGNSAFYPDMNRYFACQPSCPGYLRSDYPRILLFAYSLGIAAAICFGLFLLVPMLMGIVLNIKAREISCKQRIGLLISFVWPSFKYYAFRQRKDWTEFDLNLRTVVIVDYICAGLLSITMAIYIWFYTVGTWFDHKQIALFFILLGAYISYWLMCWSNGRAFWKAKKRFG